MINKSQLNKASISFRIMEKQWGTDKRFNDLIAMFEKNKGVTDDVTFFTAITHAPLNLKDMRQRCEILKDRMVETRKLGYRSGINILATIGHHEEAKTDTLIADYTRMTDIDGNCCQGSFCPNDEDMREYIRQLYEITALANPDYIWIDDDVRLFGHMPLKGTCFCDNCLEIFEKEMGVRYTRDSLKKAFDEGCIESKLKVRKTWLQHNRNTIAKLLKLIEKTIHGINSKIQIGFMTGERPYEGYDFDSWAKVLAGDQNVPVLWRPGGGFYCDNVLNEMTQKVHEVGRQVSLLDNDVMCIQSEIENFPYHTLRKSAKATVLEAACHIAAGCTGAAFNVLSIEDEPLDEYENLLAKIHKSRPFLDLLVSKLGRHDSVGLYTAWNKDSFTTKDIKKDSWLLSDGFMLNLGCANEIFELGLPVAYSQEQARATVMAGDSVFALSDGEIMKALSTEIYMDAEALENLNGLGYGQYTGFEISGSIDDDAIEEFTNHPLNSGIAGRWRNPRQSFASLLGWPRTAYTLDKTHENSQSIAKLVNYAGQELAFCCMGVFENELGGRVCVSGFCSWQMLQSSSKAKQIKSVMRWLSKDCIDVYVDSLHKIVLWTTVDINSLASIAIANLSLDDAESVILKVKTDRQSIEIYDMSCKKQIIESAGSDENYKSFVLPEIKSMEMKLIL